MPKIGDICVRVSVLGSALNCCLSDGTHGLRSHARQIPIKVYIRIVAVFLPNAMFIRVRRPAGALFLFPRLYSGRFGMPPLLPIIPCRLSMRVCLLSADFLNEVFTCNRFPIKTDTFQEWDWEFVESEYCLRLRRGAGVGQGWLSG